MKKLLVPTIVIMGFLFIGCEKDSPDEVYFDSPQEEILMKSKGIDIIDSETRSISGVVCYVGSKIPIPDVKITISEISANTCAEGFFCLEDIPAGTHSLVACKDDFEVCSEEVIVEDNTYEEIVVFMTSKQYSSKVFGKVKGESTTNPMVGLELFVLNPDGNESQISVETGPDGSFELSPVPQGERKVVVKCKNEVIKEVDLVLDASEFELSLEVEDIFSFRDYRDGKRYDALRIGKQTWMADNLAYREYPGNKGVGLAEDPQNQAVGEDDSYFGGPLAINSNRAYGLLYTWDEALKACPDGWHLPTDEEWKELEMNLGMSSMEANSRGRRESDNEGIKVKSTMDWMDGGNGDNQSGFNVLPAGMKRRGEEIRKGSHAYFWTATSANSKQAWFRDIYFAKSGINRLYLDKKAGYSVRCVKDAD